MGTGTPTILAATASPFKFAESVLFSINKERVEDSFTAAKSWQSIWNARAEAISRLARQKTTLYIALRQAASAGRFWRVV